MILFFAEWTTLSVLFMLVISLGIERSRLSPFKKLLVFLGAMIAIMAHLFPLLMALLFFAALRIFSHLLTPAGVVGIAAFPLFVITMIALKLYGLRKDATGTPRRASWSPRRLFTAWVVLLAITLMTLWNLTLQARVEIQALRAQAAALALTYSPPVPPESLNAAPLYSEAMAAFKAATLPEDEKTDYPTLDPRSPEVTAFLARQQKALDLFRRAADMPEFHIDLQLNNVDAINKLGYFRVGASLLQTVARAEAAAGNIDPALIDANRIHTIAYHASRLPLLVPALVALAVNNLACNADTDLLPYLSSVDQLNRLKLPDPQATLRNFVRAQRSEEAYTLASFCDAADGQAGPQIGVPVMAWPVGYFAWNTWLREDVGTFRETYDTVLDLSEQPLWKAAPQLKVMEDNFAGRKIPGLFSSLLLPALVPLHAQATKVQALQESVLAAVAATHYRLEHNSYPDSLPQLVPTPLAEIPLDPFDGKPLRFLKSADGTLTIYSVGKDLTDDGGQVIRVNKNKPPPDDGVQLKPPAQK